MQDNIRFYIPGLGIPKESWEDSSYNDSETPKTPTSIKFNMTGGKNVL